MTLYPDNNDKEVNPNYIPPASKVKRELIDRGQIQYTWWELNGKLTDGVTLQSVIRSMPTVDAVEVVHGRWSIDKSFMPFVCTCSECGAVYDIDGAFDWHYCPMCGAKMDEH